MATLVDPAAGCRLERSCGPSAADWLKIAPPRPGLERIEACFAGAAFAPHRHDTYAIGITLQGVQAFRYRGAAQNSTPGQVFVLHPDELHDGHAGTAAGFRYRILYLDPRLIQDALGPPRRPLPFVRAAVSSDRRLSAALAPALGDLATPLEDLQVDQIVLELAEALAAADPQTPRRRLAARHWRAAEQARRCSTRASPGRSAPPSWKRSPASAASRSPGTFAPVSAPAPTATSCCAGSTAPAR